MAVRFLVQCHPNRSPAGQQLGSSVGHVPFPFSGAVAARVPGSVWRFHGVSPYGHADLCCRSRAGLRATSCPSTYVLRRRWRDEDKVFGIFPGIRVRARSALPHQAEEGTPLNTLRQQPRGAVSKAAPRCFPHDPNREERHHGDESRVDY